MTAARLKIDPEILFKLDYVEALNYIKEAYRKEKEEYNLKTRMAHSIAYWQRCEPKDFPKLEDLLIKDDEEVKKVQTDDEMEDILKDFAGRNKKR